MATYNEIINDAKKAKELGDEDLELMLLKKADEAKQLEEFMYPKSTSSALREGMLLGTKGIKQAYGGATPEEIAKYKAEIKSSNPSTQATQTIGEYLPGLALGSVLTLPTSAALSAGIAKGIPYASKLLRVAAPLVEGAEAGGVSSGVLPSTEEGGQLEQMKEGAAIGAAIPAVVKPIGATLGFLKNLVTKSGQEKTAARFILDSLGRQEAEDTVASARSMGPHPLFGTQHTVPAATDNIKLQAIQRGAMSKFPEEFRMRGLTNDMLRRGYLRDMIPSDQDVNMLKITREAHTTPIKNSLSGTPDMKALESELESRQGQFITPSDKAAVIEDVLRSTRGTTDLTDLRKLIQTREDLADSLSGRPSTMFRSASKEDAVSMDQLDLIDGELDRVTGGEWSKYLSTYSKMSEPLNEAEALTNIGNTALNKSRITPDNLAATVRKFHDNPWGPNISASRSQELSDLVDDLAREQSPTRVNAGNFDSRMNKTLEALSQLEGPLVGFRNPVLGVLRAGQVIGRSGRDRAIKDLVLDPNLYASRIREAINNKYLGPSVKSKMLRRLVPTFLDEQIVNNFHSGE